MKTTLADLLDTNETIITDGAMGTLLFSQGLPRGAAPELWNVKNPKGVRAIHQAYIEAGAQIILTNTFGGNRLRLRMHDLSDRVTELNQAAGKIAREAADAAPRPVAVAGDIGPTGSIMKPWGDLEYATAVEVFTEQAAALVASGVDVLWVETMSDLEEVRAAVEGARNAAPGFPVVTTLSFDTNSHTMMGVSPEKAAESLGGFGALAIGGNCGTGVEDIDKIIAKMRASNPGATLVAKANAGLPHLDDEENPVYDGTPEIMAEYARKVKESGARIIGGCCGSTPDHIRAIAAAVQS
jgi:5-methyltetrahydrofolate--homocysteine methyltransferase